MVSKATQAPPSIVTHILSVNKILYQDAVYKGDEQWRVELLAIEMVADVIQQPSIGSWADTWRSFW